MQGDPNDAAIFNRLYEAKDAVASAVIGAGEKIRVGRRSMGLNFQESKDKSYNIGKLVYGKMQWLPAIKNVGNNLTRPLWTA